MCGVAVCVWWCEPGVEPLIVTDEPIAAAVKSVIVAARMRFGVSQVACCACSQERAPLAPAIAAIAQAAHMALIVAPRARQLAAWATRRAGAGRRSSRRGAKRVIARYAATGTDQPR